MLKFVAEIFGTRSVACIWDFFVVIHHNRFVFASFSLNKWWPGGVTAWSMQDYVGLFFPDWTMEWTKGPDNPIFTKTKSKLDHVFDTKHFLLDIFHLSTSFHHFFHFNVHFPHLWPSAFLPTQPNDRFNSFLNSVIRSILEAYVVTVWSSDLRSLQNNDLVSNQSVFYKPGISV